MLEPYGGPMAIAEIVGEEIYRFAKCNPLRPPRGGAVAVAIGVLGGGAIVLQPRALAEADIARRGGQRVIAVRTSVTATRLNFLVGQQLARVWLENESWYLGMGAEGQASLTHSVGAWIVAPTPAFVAAAKEVDGDLPSLARRFGISETCAAMRRSEAGGPDSAVTTKALVYRRGRLFAGFGDGVLRALAAAKRSPRSVRRVALRDEPDRVALFARAA